MAWSDACSVGEADWGWAEWKGRAYAGALGRSIGGGVAEDGYDRGLWAWWVKGRTEHGGSMAGKEAAKFRAGREAARALAGLVMVGVLVVLSACSSLPRTPVPAELVEGARVAGLHGVRFWGDQADEKLISRFMESIERERAAAGLAADEELPDADYLALSGGGQDGAFGAGLLCGWTARGDRPTFKVVTGISTGALIAPFAFAGPEYDFVLREVYTTISTRDIEKERSILGGLTSDAMADVHPLRDLIARYVDESFVAKVAAGYRAGRLLLLGTTNMDAQRPVMWSMGALAASGHPESVRLFRDIMLASASIPGVFPPVMFEVEAVDGGRYDEMHCDGGVSTQVFLYPAAFSFRDLPGEAAAKRTRHLYVIRNAKLSPTHEAIKRKILPITGRAIATLIKTQGVGDLYRIYLGSQRDGLDFNLASIPEDFRAESTEAFDPGYMMPLFQPG